MGKEKQLNTSENYARRVNNLRDLLPAIRAGAQVAAIDGLPLSEDSTVLAQHYNGPIVWDFFKIKGIQTNNTEELEARLFANKSHFTHDAALTALWDELSEEILSVLKQFPNYVVESEYLGIDAARDQSIRIWHRDGTASGPINYSNRLRIVRTLQGRSTEYSESERGPIVRFRDNSLCVHTCGPNGALHRSGTSGTSSRITYAIMLSPAI